MKSTARSAVQEIRRKRAERMAGAAAREAAAAAKRHGNTSKALGAELLRQKAAQTHSEKAKTPVGLASLEIRHTRERGRGITYELKAVLCGKKGCNKLHGPYWYAFWTAGGRVRSVYIGKKFQKVEEKCPERLKTPVENA